MCVSAQSIHEEKQYTRQQHVHDILQTNKTYHSTLAWSLNPPVMIVSSILLPAENVVVAFLTAIDRLLM